MGPERKASMEQEKDALAPMKQLLELLERAGKLAFMRIHVMPVLRARVRTKNKDMVGAFDFLIMANNKVGWFEVKSDTGKLRKEQEVFRDKIKNHAKWCVGRNVKDLIRFLYEEMEIDVALIG